MKPKQSYILCSTPRSGTTLLCRLLAQTGVAGRPDSFFRAQSRSTWAKHFQLPSDLSASQAAYNRAFLASALAEGSGKGGVFGLRLMQEDLTAFLDFLNVLFPNHTCDTDLIHAAFGPTQFIQIVRNDTVAQAVSLVRAQQTGLWHRNADGSELERLHPHEDPVFDFQMIDDAVRSYRAYYKGWQAWFQDIGIVPMRVTYEDLALNPQVRVADILRVLGCDPKAAHSVSPDVSTLSDQVSIDWCARYKQLCETKASPQ